MEEETFFSKVPRKNGRGIMAQVIVQSVDEGKMIYEKWRDYFSRFGVI
jgi:hypothetical protein